MDDRPQDAPPERRLPLLILEQMSNDQERDVVIALSALACSHLRWLIGADPTVDPSQLASEDFESRVTASVEEYKARALLLINAGLSDALDVVQTLVNIP